MLGAAAKQIALMSPPPPMAPRCTQCVRTCPSKSAAAAAACAPELAPSPLRPSVPPPPCCNACTCIMAWLQPAHPAAAAIKIACAAAQSKHPAAAAQDPHKSMMHPATAAISGRSRCNSHASGRSCKDIRPQPLRASSREHPSTRPQPHQDPRCPATAAASAAAAATTKQSVLSGPPATSIHAPGRSRIKIHDICKDIYIRPQPLQASGRSRRRSIRPQPTRVSRRTRACKDTWVSPASYRSIREHRMDRTTIFDKWSMRDHPVLGIPAKGDADMCKNCLILLVEIRGV